MLVEGAEAAGVVARRAAEMARPPSVWAVHGPVAEPAEPAPAPDDVAAAVADLRFAELLRRHGAQPLVEQGVLRGEVLGLEVARVVDGRLEIGVGRHDRAARAELGRDADPDRALAEVVAAVTELRRAGAPVHPANTLARSRWLRSVVCAHPALAGAAEPRPGGATTAGGRTSPTTAPCPCSAWRRTERPLVVVCSTGVDPDVIPTAADSRAQYRPDADLVVVVPEGDDHPADGRPGAALARPAALRTVPGAGKRWRSCRPIPLLTPRRCRLWAGA